MVVTEPYMKLRSGRNLRMKPDCQFLKIVRKGKMHSDEFIEWHESVISKYSDEVQLELRRARTKFLVRWIKKEKVLSGGQSRVS